MLREPVLKNLLGKGHSNSMFGFSDEHFYHMTKPTDL